MVYRPTARVLTVLELLQSHGRMSGAELAQRLEVNGRTVRHYIEMLQDLGIPVEGERGRHGAYRLRPGYKLPPLIFTEDEALALSLSLLQARRNGLAATTPAVEGVLAKIERVPPETTRILVRAVSRSVVFEGDEPYPAPSSTTVAVLSAAVQAGQRVHLRYRSAHGQVTERTFDPYGVVDHEGVWYTVGHCHLRCGQRLFRLDRVLRIVPLDTTFPRPANFDVLAAVRHALASVPGVWQVDVWLGTTLEEAHQALRLSRAYFEEVHDGVILHGSVNDLQWLARRLGGVAVLLTVRNPPELRTALRRHALALAGYARRVQS